MKTLLRGGTVVSAQGPRKADVLLEGEKILAVEEHIDPDGCHTIDCTGKYLYPGFIDGHTHFDLPVAGTVTADDFVTGSRAALRGGTTTVVDFAAPNKGESLAFGLACWHEKAEGKATCDYSFHMTIDDWNEGIRSELRDMMDAGVTSFKMYMTYPAMMIGEREMFEALQELKKAGGIAGVHCENNGVIAALTAQAKAQGRLSPASHPRTRPAALEAEAVGHLLRMAQVADCPVIIVHLSSRESLEEVRAARKRGQTVYVETCPQYLLLEDSVYDRAEYLDSAKFVCAPPIRKQEDSEALWAAIRSGEVQTVATDHCSFTLGQKMAGKDNFTAIPGGLPGVEHRGPLLLSAAAEGKLSQADVCRVLCENPAKLYGLWPRKGVIAPGSDADIVIWDPTGEGAISAADHIQNTDYTPYEGMAVKGKIFRVYLRGQTAVEEGNVLPTRGKFLPRGKNCL